MPARAKTEIRVLVVQHDRLYRDLLRVALSHASGIELVGVFADGADVVRAAAPMRPQVAVLDIDPSGHNGVALALRLRRAWPELGIVLLVSDRDSDLMASVPSHGLQAWSYFVNKTHHGLTALLRAIQVTHARLLDLGEIEAAKMQGPERPTAPRARLTRRQHEIFGLLARGLTNRAIADTLQLKEKTIENQLAAIYERLDPEGDRSRIHLRVWAALRFAQLSGADPLPTE
jgi:DNA-binding NarL/FixJ family response regulator